MTIEEREGLRILATKRSQDPRELVRGLLNQELARQGILPTNANSDVNPAKVHTSLLKGTTY